MTAVSGSLWRATAALVVLAFLAVVATGCCKNGAQGASKSQPATQVAFSRPQAGGSENHDLFIADATGRNVRQLTTSPGDEQTPKFSPDGEKIIYRAASSPEEERNLTRTPTLDEQFPAWLPDGRLSFVRGDGRDQASYAPWIADANGSAPHKLIERVSGWADWTRTR